MSNQTEFKDGQWWDVWNNVRDTEPHPMDEPWANIVLGDQCGLCGCAEYELIRAAMYRYLRGGFIDGPRDDLIGHDGDDLAQELIANHADNAGFTEHGTSLRWVWITDAGRRWLELAAPLEQP